MTEEKKTTAPDASDPARQTPNPMAFPIVGIGASVGGREAFAQFFTHMPPDSGMAFVLVQHLDLFCESTLVDLVRRYTRMPVQQVTDGVRVVPNHVYVIPPNHDMALSDGRLCLREPAQRRGLRLPIDFFFRSLAEDQKERAICIVLSGTGSDGTLGLKEVKGMGGIALAQESATAKCDEMPDNAVSTGLVDDILPPEDMPEQLLRYVQHAFAPDAPCERSLREPAQKVLFEDEPPAVPAAPLPAAEVDAGTARDRRIAKLEEELRSTRECLQTTAAELETYKKELQSVNEELVTVNHALKTKIDDLTHANEDISNLLNSVAVGIVFLDRRLQIQRFNSPAQDLIHLTDTDVGWSIQHLVTTLDDDNLVADCQTVLETLVTRETKVRARSRAHWYTLRIQPYYTLEQSIAGLVLTFADLTAQKEHLRDKETQVLFESFPLGITIADRDGNILKANQISEQLLGISLKEHARRSIDGAEWQIIRPDGSPMPAEEYASVRALQENRLVANVEMGIVKPDGSITWISVTAAPLLEDRVVVTYNDITKRRQAEKALRESEQRYRRLADNAQDMIYRMSLPDGRYEYVSPASMHLFGYSPKEFYESPRLIQCTLHPDWHSYFEEQWANLIAGNMPSIYEYQIIHKSGETRWMYQRNVLVCDDNEHPIAIEGIVTDVTARKRAEQALRDSEATLRALLNATEQSFVLLDREGTIRAFNRMAQTNAQAMFGFPMHVGDSIQRFVAEQDRGFAVNFARALAGETVYIEKPLSTPGGQTHWFAFTYHPVVQDAQQMGIVFNTIDITARKRVEKALRESEEKLRRIVENSTNLFYEHTSDHVLTYLSPQTRVLLDCEPEEAMMRWTEFATDHPINEAGFALTEKAITTGETQPPYKLELVGKRGRKIWVEVRESPIVKDGKTIAIVGSLTDITARKHAEDARRESDERYRLLAENALEGIYIVNSEGFEYVNPAFERFTGYAATEVCQPGFDLFSCIHPDDRITVQKRREQRLSGKPIPDAYTFRLLTTQGDVRYVESNTIVLPGDQLRVMGVMRDVTERKRVEEALRESEERYRTLVESAEEAITTIDADGVFLFMNGTAAQRLGGKPEDLIGQTMHDLFPPGVADRQLSDVQQVIQTGKGTVTETMTLLQGAERQYRTSIQPLRDAHGHVNAALLIARDTTVYQQALVALRESEERYRQLVETSPDSIVLTDAKANILVCNQKTADFHGYDCPEDLLGTNAFDLIAPQDIERAKLNQQKSLQEGGTRQIEYQMTRQDGSVFWGELNVTLVRNEAGQQQAFLGVTRDVTDRKRAEEALRREKERAQNYLDVAGTMFVVFNTQGEVTLINRKGCEILGYDQEDILGKNWIECFLPARMRDGVKAIFQEIMSGYVEPFEYVDGHSVLTQSGEERAMLWHNTLLRDDAGDIIGVLCSGEDITERKRAEEALAASEALYRLILSNMSDAVFITGENGALTFICPNVENLFGYSFDEVKAFGYISKLLGPDIYDPNALESSGELQNIERIITTKSGKRRVLWVNVKRVDIEDGAVLYTCRDVTARKQAEEALRRIEWLLTKSIAPASPANTAYRPPYGDVTELNTCRVILDAVGRDTLQRIAGSTIDLLNTSVAVYEKNGDYACGMFSSGWCQVMDAASRKLCGDVDNRQALTGGCWLCHENCWHDSAQVAIETGQVTDILCVGGIRLYAVPIFAGDEIVGVINIGYGDPPRDVATLEKLAADFGIGLQELETQARAYQTRPTYVIDLAKKQLHTTAMLIGEMVERKQAEKALRQTTGRLRIQHEIDVAILHAQSPRAIAAAALEHLHALIPCPRISVAELDPVQATARDIIVLDDGEMRPSRSPEWQPLSNSGPALLQALHQGRVFQVDDIAALATLSPLEQAIKDAGLRSYISVPLIARDTLFGALSLTHGTPNFFGPTHGEILKEVAASLSIALQQARLLKQTQRDAETKTLLLREVNHRVQNNLNSIISLLHMEHHYADPEAQPAFLSLVEDLTSRIMGMAELHRMLSESEWQPLKLSALSARIIQGVRTNWPQQVHVTVEVAPSSVQVAPKKAHHLALLLNEMATNTLKYAVPERDAVQIQVQIAQDEDIITLCYRDNGPGYPEDVLTLERHNAGLEIIDLVASKNLGGTLTLRNDQGAVTEIRFWKT